MENLIVFFITNDFTVVIKLDCYVTLKLTTVSYLRISISNPFSNFKDLTNFNTINFFALSLLAYRGLLIV